MAEGSHDIENHLRVCNFVSVAHCRFASEVLMVLRFGREVESAVAEAGACMDWLSDMQGDTEHVRPQGLNIRTPTTPLEKRGPQPHTYTLRGVPKARRHSRRICWGVTS